MSEHSAENDVPARVPLTCRVFGHNWEQARDSVTGPWLFRCPKCRATEPIPPASGDTAGGAE